MSANPTGNPNSIDPQALTSPREQRRAARELRRANRGGGWVGGLMLVMLGIILLVPNLGLPALNNWWALFILLPAVGAFSGAWNGYQDDREVSVRVMGALMSGIVLSGLAFALLFNLDLRLAGPIALILLGIAALAVAGPRPSSKS